MTNRIFLSTIFALAILFTGCKSENIYSNEYGGDRYVSFRISDNAATRLLGNPQEGTAAQFLRGDLYLVANGIIMRHYTINDTAPLVGANREVTTTAINIADIRHEQGVILAAVQSSVNQVVVVGNTTGNPTDGTIASVGQRLLDVFSQVQQTNGNVVNLWGSAGLRNTGTMSHNNRPLFAANDNSITPSAGNLYGDGMTLRPTVARMELRSIGSILPSAGGRIRSFTLDAIFIDRYYRHAQVSGTPSVFVTRENTPVATRADYFEINPLVGDYSLDATINALHDIIDETGDDTNNHNVLAPGTQVWGYNLFAVSGGTNRSQMPAIIIRLSEVELMCGTQMPSPQFVTARRFTCSDFPNGRPGIQAGNVYRVGAIRFDLEHLSPYPYQNPFDVEVDVTLAHWNGVEIRPPGFRNPSPMTQTLPCGQATLAFNVGRATCGDCAAPVITYQWQKSLDGIEWTVVRDFTADPNFTTPTLTQEHTYFRRLARCGCNPARINTSPAARITLPLCPVPNIHAIAFMNVLYDFQTHRFTTFVSDAMLHNWQWQVSTDNVNFTNIDISGASGDTAGAANNDDWILPADFIHNAAFDGYDVLYFRTTMFTPAGWITQESVSTLRIRFIRTTESGGNSEFLPGFGKYGGVRYAVLYRAPHLGAASGNPDIIRIALLNVGVEEDDKIGLGYLHQWGRVADGHQYIAWGRNPATRALQFNPGTSLTIARGTAIAQQIDGTGQIGTGSTHFGRFIQSPVTAPAGDWRASGQNNLWGNGSVVDNRAASPTTHTDWTHQSNNPCPDGWRVPSRFEWWDMHIGNGENIPPGNNDSSGTTGHGDFNNRWSWNSHQFTTAATVTTGAMGGVIIRNIIPGEHYGAEVFLPVVGTRAAASGALNFNPLTNPTVVNPSGIFGWYWSSTISGGNAISLWLTPTRITAGPDTDGGNFGGRTFRGHGANVRCVR